MPSSRNETPRNEEAEDFTAFLEAYGQVYPPSLPLPVGGDIARWQTAFRQALESLRGPVPERVAAQVEVREEIDAGDHLRLRLRIRVTALHTLPAYVLLPKDMAPGEQRPGILLLHGHATYGIDSVCGVRGMDRPENVPRAYGLAAVRAGYVVLAPAWWGWPGRDGHRERVGNRDACNVIQMAARMYGISVLDLHLQDAAAAVDALVQRPEVDPERIACMGNSYGGRTAMWVTVFEPRIRACISAGAMNTFRERSLKLGSCAIQYLPGLLRFGDVPEVYSLIAPRPLQLQAGAQDPLITPRDRDDMAATVAAAYTGLGAENALDIRLHPDGHLLVWSLAESFLRRHLA